MCRKFVDWMRIIYLGLGTKIQEKVISILKPTPTPRVPAVPSWARRARPTKAPRNNDTAAMRRWSRVITRSRNRNNLGSDISSTHTVVNTTIGLVSDCTKINGERRRTGCSELGVEALPQNSLNSKTCTHECKTNKGEGIRPRWIISCIGDTWLTALPECDGCGHGHKNLDESTGDEPDALLGTDAVSDPPNECTSVERYKRTQCLLICLVECLISGARCAFEEPGECNCKLLGILALNIIKTS